MMEKVKGKKAKKGEVEEFFDIDKEYKKYYNLGSAVNNSMTKVKQTPYRAVRDNNLTRRVRSFSKIS